MEAIKLKAFRSGNSLALRIPASLNLGVENDFLLEQSPDGEVVIRVARDTSREERVEAFYAALEQDEGAWNDIERPTQGRHELPEW